MKISQPTLEGAFILAIDRTQRRQAEADLLKTEKEYRSFMDSSPLFFMIYQKGIVKYANKSIIKRLGYSFKELSDPIVHPIDKIVAPRFRKEALKHREQVNTAKFIARHESALITRSGEEVDILASQRAITFQGQPAREILMEDVSELRNKDRSLRESEEEYKAFMDISPLLVLIYQDNVFKYANRSVIDRLGYSFEEISDPSFRPIETWVAPRFRKEAHENSEKRLAGRTILRHESALVTRSGEEIPNMTTQRTITFQGKPALEIMMEDITEQKKADQAMKESETRYRQLFDSSTVGNWSRDLGPIRSSLDALRDKGVKDLREYFRNHPAAIREILDHMRLVDVNDTAVKIFGAKSKDDLNSRSIEIFSQIPPETSIEFLAAIAEGLRNWETEFHCKTLDGRSVVV